ncbi:MAG: M23 family metallopeptidase [Devosia sp.]|uniref:M23 family metallopeptidase n=1 Tax=unclassified Devosia TaxID=196773 RepID=UPI0019DCD363|nr:MULTISPECIES: M23 family metallopeptidase [unclassified Devosia]MBF0679165.1 M23 family metallopeptidase [Devosia sp.]WEJ33777.1 M23 family metallopeptidase [Devosia sp. SD17-2]
MSPAQRHRQSVQLRASGFEDGPALTVQSTDGEIPQGRELSFAWLTGTVMTGLTSVLLMGAALYVSFQGQDTFSTAYAALQLAAPRIEQPVSTDLTSKSSRLRPVAATRSDLEIVEASIRQMEDGREIIRNQPFTRIRATLATTATSLSADAPAYDPVAILNATRPLQAMDLDINADVYGTDVDGEVAVRQMEMPANFVPGPAISDQIAADFVRGMADATFYTDAETPGPALAYASLGPSLSSLANEPSGTGALSGVAENVTIMPKTTQLADKGQGRTERFMTVRELGPLSETLVRNGFTRTHVSMVESTLANLIPAGGLPAGIRLRILYGPLSSDPNSLVPYRLSIYRPEGAPGDQHIATVALSDSGQYVVGLQPDWVAFPAEDVEQINVGNLPTIYRSIWETGRKHDLDNDTIQRIVAMFAYDVDMTKRITAGDTIELLSTGPSPDAKSDLLYVALTLGGTKRQLYRFAAPDGTVDFFDPDGETGKRFLNRRPLEGGGTMRSRFGYRIHPIFKTRRLHTGVDLAARTGTPIYAAGDGVITYYRWQSGYGNKIEMEHVNGYETAYGHLSRFVDGLGVGSQVRQGQLIGYVGSTGQSTGPHLHFEVKINGNYVDPLSVKLPKDNVLAPQNREAFNQTMTQINELMAREPAPVEVAASN